METFFYTKNVFLNDIKIIDLIRFTPQTLNSEN